MNFWWRARRTEGTTERTRASRRRNEKVEWLNPHRCLPSHPFVFKARAVMSTSRESIRPSLKDLSQSDDIDWPAAASSSRNVPPPSLVKKSAAPPSASSSSSAAKKTVRIAQPTDEDIRYYQPAPKERPAPPAGAHGGTNQTSRFMQRRFLSKPLDDGEEDEDEEGVPAGRFEVDLDAAEAETPVQPQPPIRPVMGGVQERPKKSRGPPQLTAPDRISGPSQGSSRFKAVREAERRAASSSSSATARPYVPPTIQSSATPRPPPPQSQPADEASSSSFGLAATSNLPRSSELADVQRPSADPEVTAPSARVINGIEEEWLDEDGQVMSAFRKARLKKAGLQPPGGIRRKKATAAAMAAATAESSRLAGRSAVIEEADNLPSESTPPASAAAGPSTGGGSDIASLMRSISSENEEKVRAMKTEDVEQDLKDLEAMFGKDMLEQLRSRKAGGGAGAGAAKSKQEEPARKPVEASGSSLPALRQPARSSRSSTPRLMFDAQGKAVASTSGSGIDEAHDHVDASQDGYSTTSVLLLARSTIAAQRTVALGIISSISARYGVQLAAKRVQREAPTLQNGHIPTTRDVATELHKSGFHLDAALTATIALSDRQRSVRHAALSCLRVALLFGALEAANSPKSENEQDDSPQRSIAQQLLDAGLLSGLGNLLAGDLSERTSSRELIVEILIQLVEHDDCVADALVQEKEGVFLESVLAVTLKLAWPAAVGNAAWPVPRAITLLKAIVASSRLNAQTLVQRESIDCVLRYIAIPPWQLGEADDDSRARALGFDLFTASLNLFTDLAKYGMYASLVSRCWDLFEPVQPWALTRLRSTSSSLELREAHLLQSYYDLLAIWTVCGIDPHQTTPEHEVTWSQLEGWVEWSGEVIKSLSVEAKDVEQRLMLFAAAGRHCKAWLDGAAINAPSLRSKVAGEVEATAGGICGKASFSAKLQGLLDVPAAMEAQANAATEDDDEEGEQRLTVSQRLVLGCQVANVVLALSPQQAKQVVTEASTELLQDLEGALSLAASAIDRHDILSLAANVALDDATSQPLVNILSLLRPGEEGFASRIISTLQTRAAAALSSQSTFASLTPFYLECLSIRPNRTLESSRPLFHPPLTPTPSTLKRTMTLRPTGPVSGHLSRVLATAEESDNTDPTTQSLLWTCPASRGLKKEGGPRPDWFLLPLDDLLRSAEAAVFNRKDNLPEEGWDPNERQVVKETLEFSLWILDQQGQDAVQKVGSLASSHLWFAAQKVFMLESGLQGDLTKWTGAVTGKDLFRDKEIEPLLARLMGCAARLAGQEAQQGEEKRRLLPTLEDLASQHLGSTDPSAPPTTYYAFYTDLVALYDAISYGHRLFAAALLPPLAMRQYPAPDYRRLLWRDHEHLLATGLGRVRIVDIVGEEKEGLQAHLEGGSEDEGEEDDLLRAYVGALLTPNRLDVTQADECLLPRIALHRVARFLWAAAAPAGTTADERQQQRQKRRAALGKTVATQASAELQEVLLRYDWRKEGGLDRDAEPQQSGGPGKFAPAQLDADELARRQSWLSSLAPKAS